MRGIIVCSLVLTLSGAQASEPEVTAPVCPPTVLESAPTVPGNAAWEAWVYKGQAEPTLESMMLFSGHPRNMGSLMPDSDRTIGRARVAQWNLQHGSTTPDFWVGCTYRNSNAMYTARLAPSLRSCTLTQTLDRAGKLAGVTRFSCSR